MDKETRNEIRNTILEIRRLLESDIPDQLEGIYGIARSGKSQPAEGISTLQENPVLRYQRQQIDAALEHERDAGLSAKQAVEQFIHETAYTALNRLVAVKMLEARSLLARTAVGDGRNSSGFKDFQMVAPQVCQSQPDGGYQLFLELLFDELAASIRPLFDRRGVHSIIFPRWTALDQMIRLLNAREMAAIWQEDETIGWVYQYFNTPDREKVRKGGRPRRPQDVAVINQFYTPRYVVEFLVDNTLGRLWYEMRRSDTCLVETCRMLVRRPDESPGDRAYKDPSEIKVLDPAVGSGHFLHYAFDLLAVMYQEAGYPAGDIPALILQNNLHGIDIDPRAAQLAAFTLYLRASAYEIAQCAPAQARLPTANIVVAEPMPGDKDLFEEFLSEQRLSDQPEIIRQGIRNICSKVWEILELAAEVGSLLKVEMALDEAIAAERARLKKEPLFDVEKLADNNVFWEELKSRIVGLFHDYYSNALGQADLSRILFAAEGEQGFRFLDLLRQDYDVVLMNPPYGHTTVKARRYLDVVFPDSSKFLEACFMERALVKARSGYIGSITSRSFMYVSRLRDFRQNTIYLSADIPLLAELGLGVLDDATTRVAASVISIQQHDKVRQPNWMFYRLDDINDDQKEGNLKELILRTNQGEKHPRVFEWSSKRLQKVADSRLAYRLTPEFEEAINASKTIEPNLGLVRAGCSTGDDFRFARLFWERPPIPRWKGFCKGGSYSSFYYDYELYIDWSEEAQSVLRTKGNKLASRTHYFKGGLSYPRINEKGFSFRILPEDFIFADKGPTIILGNPKLRYVALSLLNTEVSWYILKAFNPERGLEVDVVRNYPVPSIPQWAQEKLDIIGRRAVSLKIIERSKDELSPYFLRPALLANKQESSLLKRFNAYLGEQRAREVQILECPAEAESVLRKLFKVSEDTEADQRGLIRQRPTQYPVKLTWSKQEDKQLISLYKSKLAFSADEDEEDESSSRKRQKKLMRFRDLDEISQLLYIHPGSLAERCALLKLYRKEEFSNEIVDLISYFIGCLFNRWDVRVAGGDLESSLHPPEEGLPLYPPGALRPDSPPMEAKGALAKVLEHAATHGILVDDPGHKHDLVAGVEAYLLYLFGEEKLPAIRAEIEDALGRDLRVWLSRYFFPLHIKRYSKSRRKAPIYWQISTPGRGYSLWLYYHAIGADTLYTAVREYVSPKIMFEEDRLAECKNKFERLKTSGPAREARSAEKAVEDQESFLQELYAFRSELQRLADWGYHPDLNDGVILNIAPLYRLVPWREAEKTWEQLVQGDYDWSSMARNIISTRSKR